MYNYGQPRTNPDIEMGPDELRKKIRFEIFKMRRQNKAIEELQIQQKKIALERLEVAINTFTDKACFLKLSDDGKYVSITLKGVGSRHVYINGYKGLYMLHTILACQEFLNAGVETYHSENDNQATGKGEQKKERSGANADHKENKR